MSGKGTWLTGGVLVTLDVITPFVLFAVVQADSDTRAVAAIHAIISFFIADLLFILFPSTRNLPHQFAFMQAIGNTFHAARLTFFATEGGKKWISGEFALDLKGGKFER